jgi:RNA 2',3'-cyclic 3'-phosphodiesterase
MSDGKQLRASPSVRWFFAAIPDREARARFTAAAQALHLPHDDRLRRVPPENYHLTLAFVGEATEAQLAALRAIGCAPGGASHWGAPAAVRFDACEFWPDAGVMAATASECPAPLEELSLAIRADLYGQRLADDAKPFRPHVTLARKVSQAPVFKAMSEVLWTLREIHLVGSQSSARGSVYTVVDTWPLLDTDANHL